MKKLFYALTLLASSCATVGPDYDMARVDALRPGMTQAEVVQQLGRPTTRTSLADGTEQWMWVHAKASAFGSAESKAVMLQFGPDKRFVKLLSATETKVR